MGHGIAQIAATAGYQIIAGKFVVFIDLLLI